MKGLEPTRGREMLFLVWGGAMLRSVVVALLLLGALKHSLTSGLWSLAGFLLARLACCGVATLSMASKEPVPPKQEVSR